MLQVSEPLDALEQQLYYVHSWQLLVRDISRANSIQSVDSRGRHTNVNFLETKAQDVGQRRAPAGQQTLYFVDSSAHRSTSALPNRTSSVEYMYESSAKVGSRKTHESHHDAPKWISHVVPFWSAARRVTSEEGLNATIL